MPWFSTNHRWPRMTRVYLWDREFWFQLLSLLLYERLSAAFRADLISHYIAASSITARACLYPPPQAEAVASWPSTIRAVTIRAYLSALRFLAVRRFTPSDLPPWDPLIIRMLRGADPIMMDITADAALDTSALRPAAPHHITGSGTTDPTPDGAPISQRDSRRKARVAIPTAAVHAILRIVGPASCPNSVGAPRAHFNSASKLPQHDRAGFLCPPPDWGTHPPHSPLRHHVCGGWLSPRGHSSLQDFGAPDPHTHPAPPGRPCCLPSRGAHRVHVCSGRACVFSHVDGASPPWGCPRTAFPRLGWSRYPQQRLQL